MAQDEQTTEEQRAASSGETEQSSQQKLLTTIANFLVQWKHFNKSGEAEVAITFQEGEITASSLTVREDLALDERSE